MTLVPFPLLLSDLVLELTLGRSQLDVLLLPPEVLVDEFLQVLVDLFDHDHSLEDGGGLLFHEVYDQLELVLDTVQLSASEFEVDDPIANNPIKVSPLPHLQPKVLIIPQPVTKPLKQRQPPQPLHLLPQQQLPKYLTIRPSLNQSLLFSQHTVQYPQQRVVHLDRSVLG